MRSPSPIASNRAPKISNQIIQQVLAATPQQVPPAPAPAPAAPPLDLDFIDFKESLGVSLPDVSPAPLSV